MNSWKKGGPGVPLLNFEERPGVPLLNFEGGPEVQGARVLVPLLHHALQGIIRQALPFSKVVVCVSEL